MPYPASQSGFRARSLAGPPDGSMAGYREGSLTGRPDGSLGGYREGSMAGPPGGSLARTRAGSSDNSMAGSREGFMGAPPQRGARRCEVAPDQLLLGALILAVASVWIAVPLLALAGGRTAFQNLGVAGSLSLVALGVAQLLWALQLLLRRRTLTVGGNALLMAERGLLGVRCWREPIAHFRGLRHRRERVRGPRGWSVVHRLELVHPEPAKAICLLTTRDERRLAAAARQWARWLGLPAAVREPRDAWP